MAILADTKQKVASSHWYKADGEPCHAVPKVKGDGTRPTTIKDARQLGLFPSVTNILGVIAKPGLDKWKLKQVAGAAFRSPTDGKESLEYYCDRIIEAAFGQVVEAADLGSEIHDALEKILEGEPVEDRLLPYVQPTITWKQEHGLTFSEREVVLVNQTEGYAGRCDVIAKGKKGQLVILDYKTRRTRPDEPCTPYDGQGAQLAAYAVARWGSAMLPKVTAANVFISTTEPGRMEVCKHDDLLSEWEYFKAACAIWRHIKGYDPRRVDI
jgi:hypothetical protein